MLNLQISRLFQPYREEWSARMAYGMKKKITAPFYTVKQTSLAGYFHGEPLPNGWLYSKGKYKTKITAEDLPQHYIEGMIFKANGYISVMGIKDMIYSPNYHVNHLHKDDLLYISFDKPIRVTITERGYKDYWDYDAVLWGGMIVAYIRAIRKYQSYDIEPIAEEVKKKEKFFFENYPEECRFISKSILLE